jgi:TonB family protein
VLHVTVFTVFTGFLAFASQQPSTLAPSPSRSSPCVEALTTSTDIAVGQLCAAEDTMRRASAVAQGSQERRRQLEAAAAGFRRAVSLAATPDISVRALNLLATVYDNDHLNAPGEVEQVLRELIAVTPGDLTPMYRLAKLQEDRELIDVAESTLLDARHRQPDAEEPNRVLAQFYARRVTALHTRNLQTPPETVSNPGEADANGVYRVGDSLPAPARSDVPQYPLDALAAGVKGAVLAEIVIDPTGNVSDARVVRSIPLLDDAALQAVRNWHFSPTVVNGQPVPVRMTVTVNFAPPAGPQSPTRSPGQ